MSRFAYVAIYWDVELYNWVWDGWNADPEDDSLDSPDESGVFPCNPEDYAWDDRDVAIVEEVVEMVRDMFGEDQEYEFHFAPIG